MHALILRILYLGFLIFFFLSLFISARDFISGKNKKKISISLIGLLLFALLFFFQISALPDLALPIVLMIAVPIWLSDKNRDWDFLDKLYRNISIVTIIGAAYTMLMFTIRNSGG